ncbi:solute carrier family 12 member 8 [Acipenser ruthenus]|uniref:solute carrier family 12 member 8 n=1 Tax=Acipenser ruthenus TaxID=7906 RepID=UPI00145AF07F|nr:solute carrier family 12 member 8 [Acipenser ruthenus]XP_058888406.1 solute carrier family 12 member 8 [Acipenser ruthenus]
MEGHPGNWPALNSKSVRDNGALLGTDSSSRTTGHVQELFHEDAQVSQAQGQPWWKVQLFVWEPVLFGTWDGVFTTCMINIFGVVLFLRTGWLVGNTGVLLGMLLVSLVVVVALVTVFSGLGVCERCQVGSGGVYSMISTVLGGRVGGTVGLLYVFGQCVAGAMYITGFAESIAEVLNLSNIWAVRGISMGVLLGLLGINLAGVKWIVRLQLLLLAVLAVSALDFVVGTFSHLDPVHGFVGYSEELLSNNTLPDYTPGESFFSVFGVFFPAATGVMAGFNMSGDLQKPAINIPVGSLAAIGISWFLYLVFVFLLGAICTREALRYDFLIAEKVSLVGFLFLLGLYISSLASCMGGLYGAPRILQCIAQEKVIPILGVLGQGRGPNKTPVAAICLTSLITMAFIFIGQVNVLASIVTINFMLTYSTIDYSYFCVSMSYDLQMKQRRPLPKEESRTRNPSKPLIFGRHSDYGTDGMAKNRRNGTLLEFTKDMDQIFQTVDPDMENKEREREKKEKESKSWRTRKPAKQTLMDSFRLDLERSAASVKECAKTSNTESVNCSEAGATANSAQEEQDLMAQAFDSQEQQLVSVVLESDPRNDKAESAFQRQSSRDRDDSQEDFTAEQSLQGTEIQEKPISFYSRLCNHWVSLVGAISSLMIMFVIQWIYAFVNIGMAILLYFYIGKVSPGLPPGVAAHFSFFKWIQSSLKNIGRRGPSPQKQIVMTPSFATVGMETTQLTEENADFASRDRYHHSSIISVEELNHPLH